MNRIECDDISNETVCKSYTENMTINTDDKIYKHKILISNILHKKGSHDSLIKHDKFKNFSSNFKSPLRKNIILSPCISKYKQLENKIDIKGYVVNVYDATNFDIDVSIPNESINDYLSVVRNEYIYKDLNKKFMENPTIKNLECVETKVGYAYRCRLKGIGFDQKKYYTNFSRCSEICFDIKKLIDRCDGWVTCIISDIDIYKRLLVDITLHLPDGSINLREYILQKMSSFEIYYPYKKCKN